LAGATAWPLAARSQQPDRVRRIGMLLASAEGDPEGQPRIAEFLNQLQSLGWTEGRNIRSTIAGPPATLIGFGCSPKSWSICNPMLAN